jgi:hypothetical protein
MTPKFASILGWALGLAGVFGGWLITLPEGINIGEALVQPQTLGALLIALAGLASTASMTRRPDFIQDKLDTSGSKK